jgi:hypothetical protein
LLAEDWLKISYGIAEDIVRMIFFHTVLHNWSLGKDDWLRNYCRGN